MDQHTAPLPEAAPPPPPAEKKTGKWKWVLGLGLLILLALAGLIFFFLVFMMNRSKVAMTRVYGTQLEKLASGGTIPPDRLAVARNLQKAAQRQGATTPAVALLIGVGMNAMQDETISAQEVARMQKVLTFVEAEQGDVGYREMGTFIQSNPEIKEVFDQASPLLTTGQAPVPAEATEGDGVAGEDGPAR